LSQETLGNFLKRQRQLRQMSLAEVARVTRIPGPTLESIECDRFDELPGEVFVRGFLKSYAQAVGVVPAEVLARYTSSRRSAFVTPLPMSSPVQPARAGQSRRFGVAIAFVLLLILFTLAMSIVLKPRGHDVPPELSENGGSGEIPPSNGGSGEIPPSNGGSGEIPPSHDVSAVLSIG
jgi:cytoskeletal protein RodZ